MKNINGFEYSRTSFEDYKLRVILQIIDVEGQEHRLDIYTTQPNLDIVWNDINNSLTDKVDTFKILHHATKEQDDLDSKFIEEWLNEE